MFHTIQKGSLEYLTADALEGSVHCFTTRYGGVSTGQFSTLNLGTSRGDSMENVLRNYEILGAAVGFSPEDVVHTWQEHTDTILRVGKADCGKGLFRNQPEVCDGLITDEPGVALVCFAADCTPVLLFDPVKNVAAAVHAGWRGTALGIAAKAVEAMTREFGCEPENIGAAIGPCIGACCFETDGDVPEAMRAALGRDVRDKHRCQPGLHHVPARAVLVAPRDEGLSRLADGHHRASGGSTMKKKISLLLCAGLLLSMLTGCSGRKLDFSWFTSKFTGKTADQTQAEQEAAAAEKSAAPETTAVVTEVFNDISSFGLAYQKSYGVHPYNCESLNNRCILSFLYEPLFVVGSETFEVSPVLAESYDVSGDGLTTTVHLRPEARFSDGSPVTAQDAAYSLLSSRGTVYYGSRLRHVLSIVADDETTLTITTDTAYECLPLLLDIPIIKDGSVDEASPLGSGPYVMESDTRLVRNANWWQTAAPIVDFDEISLTLVEKTSEVRDNFEYENVNLVLTDPNSAAFAGFHNDYELWDAKSPIMQYIGYNINSKVFSNYGLRSAITYAIDREHIATDIMGGFAQAAVLPASPDAPFYDVKLANTYSYSLTKFQQQLESASVEDMDHDGTLDLYVSSLGYAVPVSGTMIVCSSSYQRVEAATEVVNALNALGFKLTLKTMELSEYRQALQTGNFDLYYGEIRLSSNFDLSPFFSVYGSMCYGGLDDSVMLNLCNQALANNGNSYNLYKRLCERGYITPVLFKHLAVYTTRGSIAHPTDYIDWFLTPPERADTVS